MKRFKLKRITALFLALIMTLSLCPVTAFAGDYSGPPTGGEADSAVQDFISVQLCDPGSGDLYTAATFDNSERLCVGKSKFDTLTEEQQEAVRNEVSNVDDLLVAGDFIRRVLDGGNYGGQPLVEITEEVSDESILVFIRGYDRFWSTLTEAQQAMVNDALAEIGGVYTVDELYEAASERKNSLQARWFLAGTSSAEWTGTLDEAVAYANSLISGTAYIQLLNDVDTTAPLEFASGKATILDLNGHDIDRGLTELTTDGYVIKVNGDLTLCDTSDSANGKITGGFDMYVGGIWVIGTGSLTMESGNICGNISTGEAGGVWVSGANSNFTMNGGTISGNGIYSSAGAVGSYGTFTMNGGTISGNTAYSGGVVCIQGMFTMTGGTISGNNASGGSSNRGGGVLKVGGTMTVSGAPVITGNVTNGTLNKETGLYEVGTSGSINNVHLANGKLITIGTLSPGTNIGVTLASCPDIFTSGGADYADDGYFFSDNEIYEVMDYGGNLMLAKMATITFNANGGSGTMNPQKFAENLDEVTLNANTFTRQGYAFTGWNTKADGTGTAVPDECTIPPFGGSVTFYAQWKHSHHNCGVADCTNSSHDHSAVTNWIELTSANLNSNGTLSLTDGNSYYLGEDITVTKTVLITGTVNLCLNGKTLKTESAAPIKVSNGEALTVCDCSGSNAGTISGKNIGIWCESLSTLTINSGTVTGKDAGVFVNSSANNASVTINGGAIIGTTYYGIQYHGTTNTVTVNGGTITGATSGIYAPVDDQYVKLYINGGMITGASAMALYTCCGTYVTGGIFNAATYGIKAVNNNLYLSGAPSINGTTGDLYLDGTKIIVNGALTNTAPFGVTMTDGIGVFAEPDGTNVTSLSSYAGKFTSDDDAYEVAVDGVNLKLVAAHDSHPTCGVTGCTASHGHNPVSTWIKLTKADLAAGTLTLTDGNSYYLGEDITVNSTITISGTVNLCLNGNTLALASGQSGSVLQMETGATLNFCDCSAPSTGIITGGNVANNGGGINVGYGNLVMYGGAISGNKAGGQGGGVFVNGGSFKMYGGSITNNSANNNAGGVYLSNCTFAISGAPIISGNTSGSGSLVNADNVYVYTYYSGGKYVPNAAITVGTLTDGANIGVRMANPITFTSGGGEYADYFTSDNEAYKVAADGNNLKLYDPTQVTVTFNANGGEGTMADQTVKISVSTKLNANTFTRENYYFAGWNTEADGSGRAYVEKESIITPTAVTLYAQWKINEARWGVANGTDAPTTWVGSGEFSKAVVYANTLTSGTAYIQMISDATLTYGPSFNSGKTTILDLNGKTLDRGRATAYDGGYAIAVYGRLTLCDSSTTDVSQQGTITGGKNSAQNSSDTSTCGGGVYVTSTGNFTMTGGNISDNTAYVGGGVFSRGTFTMTGGAISNCTASFSGGGVYVAGGTFTLNGGTISDNTAKQGGGVTVTNGTFVMQDGTISGNDASLYGGGVYYTSKSFTMTGGTISGNTASSGGAGVFVSAYASFTMEDGTISGNTTPSTAGGVYVPANATFIAKGGSITGNNARDGGGVYVSGTINVSGALNISGNTSGTGSAETANNVVGDISVGTLTTGANIGVTKASGGIFGFGGAAYADSGYFFSDSADYVIEADGNNLKLAAIETRWGVANGTAVPTEWVNSGKLTDAVAYANGLTSGVAYIQLLSDVKTSTNLVFDSGKSAVLDLNGHTIDRGLTAEASGGSVITVNGALILCDASESGEGKITGGYANFGGGVYVDTNGSFTLNSGTISGSNARYGGGVYTRGIFTMNDGVISGNSASSFGGGVSVSSSGTFTMKDGTISGNNATYNTNITPDQFGGGGVFVSGVFELAGGTIFGNTSNYGGGVFVRDNGIFTMSKGSITGNVNSKYGAGVYVYIGDFFMSGGSISGNTATIRGGGVLIENNARATMTVYGTPTISGNTKGTDANNVYLAGNKTITVNSLSSGTNIGVTMAAGMGTFTIGGDEYADSGYFTSDNAAYDVVADGENLKLYDPTQITITFDANGGEGTMAAQTVTGGVAAMLDPNTFTRTNYSFAGWNTKADGTGSVYVDRCSVTVTKAVTLYAQWKLNEARWGLANGENSDQAPTTWASSGKLTDAVAYANTLSSGTAYIQLLSDVSTSAAIVFDKTAILDLNGCDIDRGLTKATANGNVITVNGNLILLDSSESASGKITGGYNSTSAGGVHVAAGGNFVMNSGSITGNTSANHGGGVWCQGNFTMNGGTISTNVADNGKGDTGAGGGVSCSGTFTMNNGVISGNRSLYHGGGVYVNTSCVFTMNSGEISNNTGRYCGGVYVYGTATIAGGKITGNTSSDYGGGVFVPSGTLTISGNPEISGNVSASVAQNVYVYKRNPVIIDMLSAGAKIGVTLDSNAGIFTTGGAEYANSSYFFSDNADYVVVADGENLKLAEPITGSVSISGITEYGEILTASYSNETETVAYQWYRNGEAITDATENVYTLDRDDVGKSISVVVTGVGNYTGTKEAAIEGTVGKTMPSLGVVAVNGVVTDTTAPAEVVLTKTAGPEGTLVITDAAMLANQSEYHWTFTPTESNCYNAVSGTVQIDVLDTVPPTVSIKVTDTDTEWKQLLNDISFGLFFKNTQQVTITYADDETGSGLKETLYYRSNEAIADFTDVQWSTYSAPFSIDPDGEFVIYAKATDNDGNSIVVNSDGIVLDATAPVLQGITDGETYYGDTAFVVEESYLDTLKVDGIDVTAQISENGEYTIVADNAQHTITVTDKAGNETTYTVTIMKNYTVTFMADGIVVDTQTVGHGQNIPADNIPDVPYKDGCDQSEPYWSYNGAEFEPDMPITEDVVITAVYSINKHTVTFKVEDIVVDTVEVEHGGLVTPPSVPTEEGYSFYGWFTEAECINEWNTEADVVTEDLVLYAVGGLWCEAISDYAYTGTALKPEINVYFGMIPLVLNKDYTISYKNNTNVYAPVDTAEELAEFETKLAELNDPKAKTVIMNDGTVVTIAKVPQIVIKGKGNFAGTVTKYFVIEPINLNDDLVSVSDMTALYSGKVQNPKVTVSYGTKKLGTKDFTISYPDTDTTNGIPYFAAGTWTIQLDGTGNYTGTRYVDFVITKAQLMSKATIGKIAAYEYTGEEIKPAVTVMVSKTTLVENTDYTVDYLNNVEVGTATIVITGMGNYAGTKTATFKINGLAISKVQANGIPKSMMYTGSDIELTGYSLFDKAKGVMLEEETHYTVDYDKNVDKGTATILFTGINNYTGTLKKTFKIDAYDILKDVDECIGVESSIVVPFMKGGAKPDPEITFNGETLVAGVDYTLAYKNNTAVAVGDPGNTKAPTITITGKGNFSGKLTLNFSIETKSISETTLTVDDKPYAAKATGLPTVTLTDADGKKLAAGKDYDKAISYTYTTDVTLGDGTKRNAGDTVDKKDIIPVHTVIRVTVTGIGAYTGEATATYRIVPQSISKATFKIKNQTYTGKPITIDGDDISSAKLSKADLVYGTDYVIVAGSYSKNVDKGTASVVIRGIGNYGGIKTVTFKIDAKNLFWFF